MMMDRATADNALSVGWRRALVFLGGVRCRVFVPGLMCTVADLVAIGGGDALSVCLNSIAVLFLFAVDTIAFTHLLNEKLRARVLECGRVELTDENAEELRAMTRAFGPLAAFGLLVSIWVAGDQGNSYMPIFVNFAFLPLCHFAVEMQLPSRPVAERAKAIGLTTVKAFASTMLFVAVYGLANVL